MGAPYNWFNDVPLDTFAFEDLTVAAASVGFTAATYNQALGSAVSALFRVETAPIRYRLDGTAPTASVGVIADVGDEVLVWGSADIASFRAIRSTGVSAVLAVHYARAMPF